MDVKLSSHFKTRFPIAKIYLKVRLPDLFDKSAKLLKTFLQWFVSWSVALSRRVALHSWYMSSNLILSWRLDCRVTAPPTPLPLLCFLNSASVSSFCASYSYSSSASAYSSSFSSTQPSGQHGHTIDPRQDTGDSRSRALPSLCIMRRL